MCEGSESEEIQEWVKSQERSVYVSQQTTPSQFSSCGDVRNDGYLKFGQRKPCHECPFAANTEFFISKEVDLSTNVMRCHLHLDTFGFAKPDAQHS